MIEQSLALFIQDKLFCKHYSYIMITLFDKIVIILIQVPD